MKRIEPTQIDALCDTIQSALAQLENFDVLLAQHEIEVQRGAVYACMKELKAGHHLLNNLTDFPTLNLPIKQEDKDTWKRYGFAEGVYMNTFGRKININSFAAYEDAIWQINKHEQELLETDVHNG